MIGVGWNCRGLGNPRQLELIEEEDPGIIFLSETKLFVAEWDRMKARLGFRNCFPVVVKEEEGVWRCCGEIRWI